VANAVLFCEVLKVEIFIITNDNNNNYTIINIMSFLITGQIPVKKANIKLKFGLCGPDVARGPYVAPS
jgi:hypothetical protein